MPAPRASVSTRLAVSLLASFALAPIAASAFAPECAEIGRSLGPVPESRLALCRPERGAGGRGSPAAPRPFFGLEYTNRILFESDLSNPGTLTQVSDLNLWPGCDFAPFDATTLYCYDFGAAGTTYLQSFDTVTGASIPLGSGSIAVGEFVTGLAIHPLSGAAYLSVSTGASSRLFTADLATGALALVGSIGSPAIVALAISPGAGLLGLDVIDDRLVRIDVATGVGTPLGPAGYDVGFGGMDFDDLTGDCWIFALNGATLISELRSCDPVSGATAYVADLGADDPGGLVQVTSAAIPPGAPPAIPALDPRGLALFAVALAAAALAGISRIPRLRRPGGRRDARGDA